MARPRVQRPCGHAVRTCILLLACSSFLMQTPCSVHAFWFDGPTIDGDSYSYDGKGKVFNPAKAFKPSDAYASVVLQNWDMATVANLSLPRSIRSLTLSNCNLSAVPVEISTMKQLQSLSMDNNMFTTVDGALPSTLQSLNLSSNQISSFALSLPSLASLDLSANLLTELPEESLLPALRSLYVKNNLFQIQSISSKEFDFFAGLSDFEADFASPPTCPSSGNIVALKGYRVCRVDSPTSVAPFVPPPTPTRTTATTDGTPSPTDSSVPSTNQKPSAKVEVQKRTVIIVMVAVVVAAFVGACAIYVYATRRQQGIIKGALHEETPLFFDSAKRTTYHTELVAGEKLFPSNDPVLVTWRVDYDSVKLVKKLARGAFGEVWIGRYRGAKVAVKKLIEEQVSLDASEDFIREIKLMAWLEHPKVIQFIGVAWTRLTDMLAVVEFMDSGDLRSLLDTNRHLKWSPTKLKYAQDAIDAIVYLHSLSVPIIHRDLKSRNILIDSKKGAKLADFGVSATKRNDDMTTGVGTARWLAPELARGETKYTEAVDIYSFGVILAEMDTHELPFSDAMNFNGTEKLSDVAILQRVSAGKLSVSFSPRCPPKIRELAERCTSFNPKDRPAAAEVSYELRKHDVLDYPS